MNPYDPTDVLAECGALITGTHVVYASGRHGDAYVNKDAVFLRPDKLSTLALRLALAFAKSDVAAVVGPAIGGAILANAVALHLRNWSATSRDVIAAYADKNGTGGYVFGRGYDKAIAGKRVLLVEDVLTTGGTARRAAYAAREAHAEVIGLGALVNRGGVKAEDVHLPTLVSLVEIDLASWEEAACPLCAANVPVREDIGKGKEFLARKGQRP
jgi:orotate phosphoribosyltransferase